MGAFLDWELALYASCGSASPDVRRLGVVLELLYKDGCEPTMAALLDYAQVGLCRRYDIHAATSDPLAANVPTSTPAASG